MVVIHDSTLGDLDPIKSFIFYRDVFTFSMPVGTSDALAIEILKAKVRYKKKCLFIISSKANEKTFKNAV